jgi:hypothetical protein
VTGPVPHTAESCSCSLRGLGVVRATPETLPTLRKQPGPLSGLTLPANLLNHADDQTVVGVSAVLHAIVDSHLPATGFQNWGVVGSPRFPGRIFFDNSLEKFGRLGPLSVSPLIVPFLSLHALSSMVSLALRIHGPAVGAGGGCDGFVQALFTGLAMQQEQELPGVWVVMTCWDPEPFSASTSTVETQPVCLGTALALQPAAAGSRHSPGLHIVPASEQGAGASGSLPRRIRRVRGVVHWLAATTWN